MIALCLLGPMLIFSPISLVDPDARRRAQISHACSQAGLFVEPFEVPSELPVRAARHTILIHDSGQLLAETFDRCENAECWLPIVAYAANPSSIRVVEAIFAGALDYLAWPFSPCDLRRSVERARERGEAAGRRRAEGSIARRKFESLSGREQEVISGMAEGLTNKAIAERLQISPRTVECHRSNAIGKLGVVTSREAILLALAGAPAMR